ncbi:MAG: hypothetical protein JW862_19385 [Anaerolineales bacterium]|nr:hypothetical protein [Anaerolineales bacterium]
MEAHRHIWQAWERALDRWGIKELVATLLEAIGPLNLLGAQVVYLGQPFLNRVLPAGYLDVLAGVLEDPEITQDFTRFLREQDHQSR